MSPEIWPKTLPDRHSISSTGEPVLEPATIVYDIWVRIPGDVQRAWIATAVSQARARAMAADIASGRLPVRILPAGAGHIAVWADVEPEQDTSLPTVAVC